jgi:FkbM family methyltransferase
MRALIKKIALVCRNTLIRMPKPQVHKDLLTLGTSYGQKTLDVSKAMNYIVSAGAGDDISWESELIARYKVSIALLDPTDLAKDFVKSYLHSNQYLMNRKTGSILVFLQLALWNRSGFIEMYAPQVLGDNNYSISDTQDTKSYLPSIKVECITIVELMEILNWRHLDVLKLDIEGGVYEVLKHMFDSQIYPTQILIEVDELFFVNPKNLIKARRIFSLLIKHEYICVYRRYFDFTYVYKPH